MPPSVKRPHGRCLHAAVPKATFTYALTLMDKVGRWNDEEWIGPTFAACMKIYTKAVCNKKRCSGEPSLDLDFAQGIIGESVTWVTEVCLWEHEWIIGTDVTLKENEVLETLNYEIEVPCPLQSRLLWFSPPTNLDPKFMNNGTTIAKFRKIVNHAIELSCNIVLDRTHTPRALLVRTVTVLLCSAHDKDWNLKEEMQG